jgi:hypothetical protein
MSFMLCTRYIYIYIYRNQISLPRPSQPASQTQPAQPHPASPAQPNPTLPLPACAMPTGGGVVSYQGKSVTWGGPGAESVRAFLSVFYSVCFFLGKRRVECPFWSQKAFPLQEIDKITVPTSSFVVFFCSPDAQTIVNEAPVIKYMTQTRTKRHARCCQARFYR